jgi:predicted enzyme related to lactoylglutathione lyase
VSGRAVHFEIGCRDTAKAAAFYTAAFGWTTTPYIGTALHAHTGKPETISGHFTSLGHEPHNYVTIYVEVDDIGAAIEKVIANGGQKPAGPIPLPDGNSFAWTKDPDGNIIAMITPAPVKA